MLCWLSNNSEAIQSILSGITIVVLVFTWRAANKQAHAAEAQAEAARALTIVGKAQTAAAEIAAQLALKANELTRIQMLARMRPILVMVQDPLRRAGTADKMNYFIRNQGPGAAQHVAWWYGRPNRPPRFDQRVSSSLIGSGHDAEIVLNLDQVAHDEVTISYDSLDGQGYLTFVSIENGGLLQVQIERT